MKKLMLILILAIILVLILAGIIKLNENLDAENKQEQQPSNSVTNQTTENTSNKDTIVIGEKMFMNELNDIYMNYKEYEGKVIEFDGFVYNDEPTSAMVVGREYYCCGDDSYIVGLQCRPKEGSENITFTNDIWVKVTGTVKLVADENVEDMSYPIIEINTIQETEEGERVVYY